MLSPRGIQTASKLVVVPDSTYGDNGSALSEYAQLFWLYDNLDRVASGFNFMRIFHYRRFVSPAPPPVGTRSVNQCWSTAIQPAQLHYFDGAFDRTATQELANSPTSFPGGVLGQYAHSHHLEDMLRFTEFLSAQSILGPKSAAEFIQSSTLIPSSSIGVFSVKTFREIYRSLRPASDFLCSPLFTARQGYQRRSAGFLLERFQSYLILRHIREHQNQEMNIGYNVVISDTPTVHSTIDI